MSYAWTDTEDIAIDLTEAHRGVDPLSVRFTQLRQMVEALPGFEAEPGHAVNEQILEAIQAAWHEEVQDDDAHGNYSPVQPFKPED